jgi:hypothetical protein
VSTPHFAQNGELDSVDDDVLLRRDDLDEETRAEAENILLKIPSSAAGDPAAVDAT